MTAKIALRAPLTRLEHLDRLAAAGADKFYCGFTDGNALDGRVGANHRQGPLSNFLDKAELAQAVTRGRELGREISLTLNARSISDEAEPVFREQLGMAIELDVEGVIIGNWLGLLLAHEIIKGPRPRIQCGVNVGILNAAAAREARDLGASSVTLARHLTTDEILEIAAAVPELDFEVFALNGHCGYYDAYCGFHYDYIPGQIADFASGCLFVEDQRVPRYERYGCSACRVVRVMGAPNVVATKLVGRDFDPERMLHDLAFLRELVDSAGRASASERPAEARRIYARHRGRPCPEGCVRGR